MNKMLRIFLPLTLMTGFLFSQTVEGNYELNYVTVHYTYEIRDSSASSIGAGGGTSGEQWSFGETDSNYVYHGVHLKQRDGGEFFVSAVRW